MALPATRFKNRLDVFGERDWPVGGAGDRGCNRQEREHERDARHSKLIILQPEGDARRQPESQDAGRWARLPMVFRSVVPGTFSTAEMPMLAL